MSGRAGRLTIVGTPIGNLGDLAPRAVAALGEADLIACEDTRRTGTLLAAHDIRTPMRAVHAHNEASQVDSLVEAMRGGATVALVSDAGMPAVSDPGARLVAAAHREGIPVEVVPGPSALTTAVAASGVAADAVAFVGFFPRRPGERTALLDRMDAVGAAIVGFESPQRLPGLLAALAERDPARTAAVCRELTKLHEDVRVAPVASLARDFATVPRGEITVVLWPAAPAEEDPEGLQRVVEVLLDAGLSPSAAARTAAELGAGSRNAAYALATAVRREAR